MRKVGSRKGNDKLIKKRDKNQMRRKKYKKERDTGIEKEKHERFI